MKKKKKKVVRSEEVCSRIECPRKNFLGRCGKVLLLTASYQAFSVLLGAADVQASRPGHSLSVFDSADTQYPPGIFLSCIGCTTGPDNIPCAGTGCSCTSGMGGGNQRLERIEEESNRQIQTRRESARQSWLQAGDLWNAGRYREALDAYMRAKNNYPDLWPAELDLSVESTRYMIFVTDASAAAEAGDYERAVGLIRKAMSIYNNFASRMPVPVSYADLEKYLKIYEANIYTKKGIDSYKAKDWAKAAEYFREALRRVPDDKTYQRNLRLAETQLESETANRDSAAMHKSIENFVRSEPKTAAPSGDLDFMSAENTASRPRKVKKGLSDNSASSKSGPMKGGREELEGRITRLTKEIEDTQKQLDRLGFKQRAEDFDQIKEISTAAVAEFKAKILEHLQELITDEAADQMEKRFLKKIKKTKPYELKDMLKKLEDAGVSDPFFLGWISSFERNKSRAELVKDAQKVIAYLKMAGRFSELFQKSGDAGVRGQQEAVIKLINLVMEHPYLAELKPAAHVGVVSYDVAEAWLFYGILSMEQGDLMSVTEKQLRDQKLLMKRMEALMKKRTDAQKELSEAR